MKHHIVIVYQTVPPHGPGFTDTQTGLRLTLDYTSLYQKFDYSKSSSFSLSFSPSLASLYLFEQCLRLGVIGTCSVCLPLQD